MRRTFLSVTLSLLLCCLFAACGVVPTAPNAEAPTAAPTETISPTAVPTPTPKPTPSPTATPEPTPTPYDPYTLSDEEAIEMGSYIYDNYIARYIEVEGSFFNEHSNLYHKEDIINLVCLFNQRPVVYMDRYRSIQSHYTYDGVFRDTHCANDFYESIVDVTSEFNINEGKTENFPYSLFMKEGRPEQIFLQDLEREFDSICYNEVTQEKVFQCWGKALKSAVNGKVVFQDWNTFNLPMFYNYIRQQYYQLMILMNRFHMNDFNIPAKYVFENDENQELAIYDAMGYVDTTNRNTYRFLTDEEYNAYIACMDRIIVAYIKEYEPENSYIEGPGLFD